MILTPLVIAQLFSIGTGLGSQVMKMTGNDEVAQKLAIASMVSGAVSSAGGALKDAFTAPSTGLKIADSKSIEAFNKNPEGIFGGALPKGGNFDLPKGLIDGGFGLEMPKDWIPKTKGIFDPPGKEELGIGWIKGLEGLGF